jgi:hypothetical protein
LDSGKRHLTRITVNGEPNNGVVCTSLPRRQTRRTFDLEEGETIMQHLKNMLLVIGGTVLCAALIAVAFLIVSLFMPDMIGEMGAGYQQPPNPAKGREIFCAIGLTFGAIFGAVFMVISLAASGINNRSKRPEDVQGK